MRYFIIDACLNGSGIRDKYSKGYIDPGELHLSYDLIVRLAKWLEKYNKEFFNQYRYKETNEQLDEEGKEIAIQLKKELKCDVKVEYFSDAKMNYVMI